MDSESKVETNNGLKVEDNLYLGKYKLFTIETEDDTNFLRQPSKKVEFVVADNSGDCLLTNEDQELVNALKSYTVENNGLGMSAVQLGVHKSIFVMRKPWNSANIITVINPKLIRGEGKSKKAEGCFSFPMLSEINSSPVIERYSKIWVNYEDEKGEAFKEEFLIGMDSRIWLHEYEHTLGRLMIDGQSRLGRFVGWNRPS